MPGRRGGGTLGAMIEVTGLTKRFGGVPAVEDASFTVRPGAVTGFLGPNGAGKTTTLRMILGLDRPDAGTALIDGRRYPELEHPARVVGALLDAGDITPRRRARDHLRWLAAAAGIGDDRVEEVLGLVGLADVAGKRAGEFSLGMLQRLGLAAALLGDPAHLVLDEPVNGLDPEGIAWVRGLLRTLAAEGRTVLVSSHLLAEMARTADHLIVIGRGRILADAPAAELAAGAGPRTRVAATDPEALRRALAAAGLAPVAGGGAGGALVVPAAAAEVGRAALAGGVALTELTAVGGGLEEAFMELTGSAVDYRGGAA